MYINEKEFLFVEKYRPKSVEECILPDRLKKVFESYVISEKIPNLLLYGPAGCGKTTVAKAVCNEVGCNFIYINASLERGIDTLRTKIVGYASTVSMNGGPKVIILDEADGLTRETQDALRGAIEQFSSNCTFILTVNHKAKLIDALHSRCTGLDFFLAKNERPKMASMIFKRVENILEKEGIEYDKQVLIKIVEKFFPDYRRLIGELQRFSTFGVIDSGTLAQLDNVRELEGLMKSLKEKDFGTMRKWVVNNSDIDAATIFKKVYDSLYGYLKPEYIPQAVIIIAKYMYQSAFCVDQEINTTACLTELMVELEYK